MLSEPLGDGPLVVLGVTWTEATAGGCHLRVRRPGKPSVLLPAVGFEINYRCDPEGPRHCLGHQSPRRNEGRYQECHNRPQRGEKTCTSCSVANAEFAADLHHAHTRNAEEIHQAVRTHLQKENALYLAAFRDGSIKVGTSTMGRRHLRWAEQGAWRVIEAARTSDGFLVRHLEDLVTRELGLPQSVNASRKLKGLVAPLADSELEATLARHAADVHHLIAEPPTGSGLADGGTGFDAAPTDVAWAFPADVTYFANLHRYPVKLTAGHHHLRIEATCGRLAVVTKPSGQPGAHGADRFAVDLGQLAGREIELGEFQPEELMVQDSLF